MSEERNAKIIFAKSGGTAKGKAITNRLTIPTNWVKKIGVTEDSRDVCIKLIDDKIIIEKAKD